MSLIQRAISVPGGSAPAFQDRAIIGSQQGIANAAGAAGVTVTVAVSFADLPPNYSALVNPGQGCGWFISGKTNSGFNVNLVPFSSTAIVAAGSFDVTVIA
ncbi:MAG: hypothetical protein ACYC0M_15745 [Burkholderiales bacterium]